MLFGFQFVIEDPAADSPEVLGGVALADDKEALAHAQGVIRDIVAGDAGDHPGRVLVVRQGRRNVARVPF